MANKMCTECKIRPIDWSTQGRDSWACTPCFDYAGAENEHSDNAHDVYSTPESIAQAREDFGDVHVDVRLDEMINCPVCHPELDPRKENEVISTPRPAQRGNRNAAGKQSSHKMCGHPLTKAAREKCRQLRRQQSETPVTDECPRCHARGDEKCKTATGGRYKGKGGRHPERDA